MFPRNRLEPIFCAGVLFYNIQHTQDGELLLWTAKQRGRDMGVGTIFSKGGQNGKISFFPFETKKATLFAKIVI